MRIGLVRQASAAPLYIAVSAGYLQAEGLEPQVEFLPTHPSVAAAVASGKVDIGLSDLSAGFYRDAAAHRLKIIASHASDQAGFPIYALLIGSKAHRAGFTDLRGLPGARIGTARSEPGAYYELFSAASRFGLATGRFNVMWLESPRDELTALSRGDVDAVLLPFATAIQSAAKGDTLLRLGDLASSQQGILFTAADHIAAHRAQIERFIRAYQRGTAEYQLNFLNYDDAGDFIPGPNYDGYLRVIARQSHVPANVVAMTKTYCDRRANPDAADIGRQVHFWQELGQLDRSIEAADLLDRSFIGEEPAATQTPKPR